MHYDMANSWCLFPQFLESYKSVTLQSMAIAFGVSPAFLDDELADFIVAGRLPAKIDKVSGIIETNRRAHFSHLGVLAPTEHSSTFVWLGTPNGSVLGG